MTRVSLCFRESTNGTVDAEVLLSISGSVSANVSTEAVLLIGAAVEEEGVIELADQNVTVDGIVVIVVNETGDEVQGMYVYAYNNEQQDRSNH